MKKRALSALLSLILIISLFSCDGGGELSGGGEIKKKSRTFFEDYFNAGYSTVYDYSGSPEGDFELLCDRINEKLAHYHRLFDIYNEYEGIINLATLNRTAGEGKMTVDPEICELLSFAKRMHGLTGGKVNVAMGSVLSLWHDARTEGTSLPDADALLAAAEHTDIENVVIDTAASTVEILDRKTQIDVGAVAKGYASEKICEFIKSQGLSGYAIDIGGNLCVVGTKPDGSGVISGILSPSGAAVNPIPLANSALVTSGVYQRFYTVGGIDYHHIINPDTLMPDGRYWSLTVHTASGAVADALSTAFFNMSEDEIRAALPSFSGTEVTVIYPDGSILEIK